MGRRNRILFLFARHKRKTENRKDSLKLFTNFAQKDKIESKQVRSWSIMLFHSLKKVEISWNYRLACWQVEFSSWGHLPNSWGIWLSFLQARDISDGSLEISIKTSRNVSSHCKKLFVWFSVSLWMSVLVNIVYRQKTNS